MYIYTCVIHLCVTVFARTLYVHTCQYFKKYYFKIFNQRKLGIEQHNNSQLLNYIAISISTYISNQESQM